ncbi:flagellar type III secretion system pore protein FliP [Georgenia yuyongxinii]|uniref:Flagellar biosynthetic protein FliP n=1 Tax=Georgenia yuyongxinii TaxID=2589797 RepID=A0A552WS38_9MICO|nr:flagellar type III secretion system pore protein FliP [Georgenia yuyongxinii]
MSTLVGTAVPGPGTAYNPRGLDCDVVAVSPTPETAASSQSAARQTPEQRAGSSVTLLGCPTPRKPQQRHTRPSALAHRPADRGSIRRARPFAAAAGAPRAPAANAGAGHERARWAQTRRTRTLGLTVLALAVAVVLVVLAATGALAAPTDPTPPTDPTAPRDPALDITVDGEPVAPSTSVVVLLGITLLSVAPSLLLMMTSFTKIFVVLALTRNALGLQGVPPNQVLAGLALFLSIFIMFPILGDINAIAVQPYLAGDLTFTAALDTAADPLRTFMLGQTREEDIALLTRAAEMPNPASPETTPMQTLIPAFMLSELRAGFVIGFVIFVPFLVIDLVTSAVLMSMGMMMLPPVMISLPFKILLFVLVDGWGLIVTTLVGSY